MKLVTLKSAVANGMIRVFLAAVASSTLSFASDTILLNGHIYTGNDKAPWAQALAISGSRIDAIGTDQNISKLWGATLAFSSDWPCTWPPDPFVGIQEAVTREVRRLPADTKRGTPEYNLPEERITVEQAVRAYTRASAYARFSEDRLGSLEPGKEADLVVLSQDIFASRTIR
jgi:predicted amidohydrolase YtcJ